MIIIIIIIIIINIIINHSEQYMVVYLLPTSRQFRKLQNSRARIYFSNQLSWYNNIG